MFCPSMFCPLFVIFALGQIIMHYAFYNVLQCFFLFIFSFLIKSVKKSYFDACKLVVFSQFIYYLLEINLNM